MFPWKEKYFSDRDGIYIPIQSRFLTNVIRLCLLSRGSARQQSPTADTLLILFSFIGSNLCFLFSASTSTCFQQFPLCLSWPWTHSDKMYVFCIYTELSFLLYVSWCAGWNDVIKHSAPGPRESGWYGASWFVKWIKGKL